MLIKGKVEKTMIVFETISAICIEYKCESNYENY